MDVQLIQTSSLFRALQPAEMEAMLARLQIVQYARGQLIMQHGMWHGRLYIIVSGIVSVLPAEASQAIARLGRGECFGELSLLTGEPPNATIQVEQDVTLLELAQTDLLTLIGTCPTLLKNMHTILAQRLTRTNQQLAAIQRHAQLIILSSVNAHEALSPYQLPIHIATALATRTHKRVLLLELCELAQSSSAHFATHPDQLRPSLVTCLREPSALQAHYAPTLTDTHFPALATFADTADQLAIASNQVQEVLTELALLYDYVLLAITPATSARIATALLADELRPWYAVRQHIVLIDAASVQQEYARQLARGADAVFVVDVPELPTIAVQDGYEAQLGHVVTRLLSAQNVLLHRSWQQSLPLTILAQEEPLSRGVDFVARYIARQTVGIAFGGGGARGFAHLGVLESLLAHRVPLDYIAACSSGIITAGTYLLGKSFAESEEIFMQIQRNIVRWTIPRTAMFSNRGIKQMLLDLCGDTRFEDLTTPFAMVAVDLTTRSGVVLDRGPLWQAGLASVALPGIFPPVKIGEHLLMDAGIHDPVPIRLIRTMGAHILLASELGGQEPPALERAALWPTEVTRKHQSRERSPYIVDLLARSYDLIMATVGMHSIREADVVFRPKLYPIPLRQFSKGRAFIATGSASVEEMLPQLRQYLPWLS